MRVTLLGPVAAAAGGVQLALGGTKQRAVFALMALNAGRVVPLDRLVDELWSDEPPSRATLSLQSYVARLRGVLAGVSPVDREAPRILTRPPGWVLTLDPEQVDVTRFEGLISAARRSLEGGGTAGIASGGRSLEEALTLFVGEPLAGLEGMRFAREEAARLTELRLDATELLLQAHLDLGRAVSVAERAARFVNENPFRERAWGLLMLALYRSGRQSEALAAAARLRRALASELGVDPSLEIRRLEEQILRQDVALGSSGDLVGSSRQGRPSWEQADGSGDESARALLVGRGDVLAVVDAAVAQAEEGEGRLLVLHAPAGLGKSSILQALEQRVLAGGGAVLRGDCAGAGQAPALWPWVSIVRAIGPGGDAGPPGGGVPPTPLALLLSETGPGDGVSRPLVGADSVLSRTRLFRSVIDAVAEARAVRPVAVVMDDLHWADAETMTLLTLAVDELARRGVLLAVAIRSDEPDADGVLGLLDRVRRGVVQRVALAPLDTSEVAALVHDLSGADADAEVVAVIHARTAGNPLFVRELVQLLLSERRLDVEGVRTALPTEVREVLRRRLDRLPQQTVAVLTVIAVAGGPAQVDLLAEVTGLDHDSVLDACEAAVLTGLLLDDAQQPGAFLLSHDLVRQTLEQSLSTARRLRLHARIAEALVARGSMAPPQIVEVARHLALAAPVVGPAAAVPYLVAASDDALSRYAGDQAERHLMSALELISQIPAGTARAALEGPVRGRLGLLLLLLPGMRTSEFGSESAVPAPTDAESAIGWMGSMIRAIIAGEADRAAVASETVLAEAALPVALFSAHFVRGFAGHVTGRIGLAEQEFEAVETLVEQGVDVQIPGIFPGAVVNAGQWALVAHALGDEQRADSLLLTATRRAADSEPALMVSALHGSMLSAMRGDVAGARSHSAECGRLARRLDSAVYVDETEMFAAWADALEGDVSGADRADVSFDRYLATGIRVFVPMYLLLRAEAHAACGHVQRSRQLIADSRAVRAETGEVCSSPRLLAWAAAQVPVPA